MNREFRPAGRATGFRAEVARRWHRPAWFATLLAFSVMAANSEVVSGAATFGLRDFSLFGFPLAAHVRESLWAGELPLWNPLSECGHPFLAQWNTLVLYPFMLFALLFPLAWSLGIFCLAHQFVGGLGMYLLARRWTRNGPAGALAGVIYAFDGIMQNSLMWPNNIAALGLLPWVLLAVQSGWRSGRRPLLVAGGVAALQLLAGAPEIILITWLFALLVLSADCAGRPCREQTRRYVSRGGFIVGGAALLAAVQLVPFFDLLIHSGRLASGGRVTSYIHWQGWANFLLPLFGVHGREPAGLFMHHSQIWTHSYYLGYLPWMLLGPALVGNRGSLARNLAACAALSIILAMGPEGRLYDWLAACLPLELMRYPVKFLLVCKVAMPLLAAWGIKRMVLSEARRRTFWSVAVVAVFFVGAVMLLDNPFLPAAGKVSAFADVPRRLAWLIPVGLVLLYLPRIRGRLRSIILLLLTVFVTADLLNHQPSLSPSVDPDVYACVNRNAGQLAGAKYPLGRALPAMAVIERQVYGEIPPLAEFIPEMRDGLAFNLNLLDGISSVGGFYSLHLPPFKEVSSGLFGEDGELNDPLADFIGVMRTTGGGAGTFWVPRPHARAMVTVGREPFFGKPAEVLERVREGRFDPGRQVLLQEGAEVALGHGAVPEARVSVIRLAAHHIEFRVETPRPTVATIAQVGYHWWQAEVDGRAVPIHAANHAFQALSIPAGAHLVVLRYVDRGFQAGAILSALALLAGMIGWRRMKADGLQGVGREGVADGKNSPLAGPRS